MIIIPAIDLIDGKCVRLYQGDFNKTTEVGSDPRSQIQQFLTDGAKIVHIVDLDGARAGEAKQYGLIQDLAKMSTVPIQVGGGIRNLQTVERYLEAGVTRIVLGTAALEDNTFVTEALTQFRDHIVIGIDAKNGQVATRGWETVTAIDFIEFAKQMEALGAKTIVFTDISRDGTMTGPNLAQLKQISEAVTCTIVASGGIRSMDDLTDLAGIGMKEAIVGKAIYDGSIKLKEVQQ
ncbi:1-(5-phosphoribosyl)-5-[(5-phosphoribosylamino)methylideneamino]imidazole-4-carboxamide isomerase [Bacillus chungangensis]|uniref:1-(5-phosphoribosyl)-5-[(5-phosphoribosylamino)methylideneamino] imidazole-4-carboxamide isomerase n=1 Tax=Bacillus chungangensis TaxID=587633 RepID=A0ABT9WX28_9BACI|nr:1-(5-phosphoribosyl)-5-[(5-phosphoribosylamino)methylideneamino]imidazole-4-carboxamide isomerase [Bacillus chungangensis]MDQ0177422.1 phosphoribosylformimino-5-aminoimidazole carboxamide ribotide isomerase [Bacillus chungangensis]